uniref:Sema domain-containing protein n=1 Tax=Ciona savignyi TaxID=51511 RepID=H2ZQB2_CIOSA
MIRTEIVFVTLLGWTVFSEAGLLGGLSMPPDLAFLFNGNRNQMNATLYNYNASASEFVSLGTYPSGVFFPGMPRRISSSAYVLTGKGGEYVTTFFKNRDVYFSNGTNGALVRSMFNISMLFDNGPWRADAAYTVLNGEREVIGTNFILRHKLYECGALGTTCNSSTLHTVATFSTSFLRDGRIRAALGLSDGKVALFKTKVYAIVHKKGDPAEERPMFT